jgi:hypothetical protein
MARAAILSSSLVILGALTGCGSLAATPGDDPKPGTLDGGTKFPLTGTPLPCDVDDVLARRCRTCHVNPPEHGAPMPLLFQENLDAPARSDPSRKVYELVHERIHDDAFPMPQPPNARLDERDMKTLDDWIAKGAPHATSCAADGGTPLPDSGPPILTACTPDMHMKPSSAWVMPETTDDVYVCYGFDITPGVKRHVTAIAPIVQNGAIVHHALLYQADTAVDSKPTVCDPGGATKWRIVYGWAPGGLAMELPPEAGFALEGTTHYVAQIHYSNLTHLANQADATGFDLCTTDQLRPNDADVLAFGSMNFEIKPHSTLDTTCSITLPTLIPKVHVFSAFPHMHQLGKSIGTTVLPAGGGAPIDLGGQAHWNFANQLWFPLDTMVGGGDTVQTRCAWTNPGDKPVSFGSATSDEMCYSFTAYYPKIKFPQWSWALPANGSTCQENK